MFVVGEHYSRRQGEAASIDRLSDPELDSLLSYYEQRIEANRADLGDYELYVAGQRERIRRRMAA